VGEKGKPHTGGLEGILDPKTKCRWFWGKRVHGQKHLAKQKRGGPEYIKPKCVNRGRFPSTEPRPNADKGALGRGSASLHKKKKKSIGGAKGNATRGEQKSEKKKAITPLKGRKLEKKTPKLGKKKRTRTKIGGGGTYPQKKWARQGQGKGKAGVFLVKGGKNVQKSLPWCKGKTKAHR